MWEWIRPNCLCHSETLANLAASALPWFWLFIIVHHYKSLLSINNNYSLLFIIICYHSEIANLASASRRRMWPFLQKRPNFGAKETYSRSKSDLISVSAPLWSSAANVAASAAALTIFPVRKHILFIIERILSNCIGGHILSSPAPRRWMIEHLSVKAHTYACMSVCIHVCTYMLRPN